MASARIGIVGAGIIGLAVARRIGQIEPNAEIVVLEKEAAPGGHQTARNSGVAHAGLYYAPGSLKARLCRRGIVLLKDFCAEHGLPYEECGKLVVARDATELGRLDEIEYRARSNGVPGLRRLGAAAMTELEPHVRGVSALHSPSTAIVDFTAVARALADEVTQAGGQVITRFPVGTLERRGRHEVVLGDGAGRELAVDRAVLCAGLYSDRLAVKAGDARDPVIVPFRGEYHRLVPGRDHLVRGLIYPVPDPRLPFLGVHFTRRVAGGVDVGPNAILALAREGYRWRDVNFGELRETVTAPGFRRLARRHWRTGLHELCGSLSRRVFLAEAKSFLPELEMSDVVPAPAGVRAQAVDADGTLVDDFRISELDRVLAVRNAPSPAATSSLAIAEHVGERVLAHIKRAG